MDENWKSPAKQATNVAQDGSSMSLNAGNINFAEIRDVKIKLSRKEKEFKDLQEQLA